MSDVVAALERIAKLLWSQSVGLRITWVPDLRRAPRMEHLNAVDEHASCCLGRDKTVTVEMISPSVGAWVARVEVFAPADGYVVVSGSSRRCRRATLECSNSAEKPRVRFDVGRGEFGLIALPGKSSSRV